jgi:Short C-terminal domain
MMRDWSASRRDRPDLLARPPCVAATYDDSWVGLVVDPTDQLEALADLLARGLLSSDEFDREKAKILER